MKRLEAEHWPSDPFDKAVILLNDVVVVVVLFTRIVADFVLCFQRKFVVLFMRLPG